MKTFRITGSVSVIISCRLYARGSFPPRAVNTRTRLLKMPRGLRALTPQREGEQIAARYRALDNSNQSVSKTTAVVKEADGSTREVAMSISRKLAADGRRLMLVEFTSPAEERDRNALVITSPQGDIEATRYIQSNNTFASVNNVVSEDSLFGMTMQELADGQTEKYTFRLVGEESFEGKPVYRIEGKLKDGMESKFPRLVMLVSKENSAALVAEFYDNQNQLIRRVTD